MTEPAYSDAIAIVGGACRFGDIEGLEAYWDAIEGGRELVDRLAVDGQASGESAWVQAGGVLRNATGFDAELFSMSPREAELTDPQQRVFLETCWHALEHAGYDPGRFSGEIGVFAGSGINTYLPMVRAAQQSWTVSPMAVDLGNEKDFLATRVSYKLGMTGPSVSVQTACSTSLVAVHLACQSLADYECDMALAGGCSIALERSQGYPYTADGILSPDGYCRPFDARAQGTVPSDGAAAVVLRRWDDALRDGDHVLAVIRGSAIRNDGRSKAGFSAPSVDGQVAAMRAAYQVAGVSPATVDFVEAHGTGTALGDPIELAALDEVLGEGRGDGGPCYVGAVKALLGHTDTVAGLAGMFAAVLSLKRAVLLPVHHFEQASPRLRLGPGRLCILRTAEPWHGRTHPRRAAVNSLGVGGTNAHVVMEEVPVAARSDGPAGWQVLPLSAATPDALMSTAPRLRDHLVAHPDISLGDVAYTLQMGRKPLRYRSAAIAKETPNLIRGLGDAQLVANRLPVKASEPQRIAFLLPGGGAQRVSMAEDLYRELSLFRQSFDALLEKLGPQLDAELLTWARHGLTAEYAASWIERPPQALPALFAVEFSVSTTLLELGLQPYGMLGHSLGEYVAACVAGVMSPEDAFAIVCERGRLLGEITDGAMLSVPLAEDSLLPMLTSDVDLAAINSDEQCVLSGPATALGEIRDLLARQGIESTSLPLATAAHSRAVVPYLARFYRFLEGIELHAPRLPFISNGTGAWVEAEEVTTPRYWVRHLRETVRFQAGLRTLIGGDGPTVLLEVGPGTTLTSIARRSTGTADVEVLPVCGHRDDPRSTTEVFLTTIAKLWTNGAEINWPRLHAGRSVRRVPCPVYPFERRHFNVSAQAAAPPTPSAKQGVQVLLPSWRRLSMLELGPNTLTPRSWLIVGEGDIGARIAHRLGSMGQSVSVVRATELTPDRLAALSGRDHVPVEVVSTVALAPAGGEADLYERYKANLSAAAALGSAVTHAELESLTCTVLTNHVLEVTGADRVDPARAPYDALCSALRAECRAHARLLDLDPLVSVEELVAQVVAPLLGTHRPPRAALRAGRWWIPEFAPSSFAGEVDLLPERPVVLITGGLGGIGSLLAEHLVRTRGAQLVLVSRNGADGPNHLARQQVVHRLVEAGGDVSVVRADVADPRQARRAVGVALERFGALHLVVHAAAVPFGTILEMRDEEVALASHAPKVVGLLALREALSSLPNVVLMLTSSMASANGAIGSFDYMSANGFLDKYAQSRKLLGESRVVSVAWDRWRGVGMARALEERHADLTGVRLTSGMDPQEAAAALDRCLNVAAMGEPHVTVSAPDGHVARPSPRQPQKPESRQSDDHDPHQRPIHLGTYVPPATEVEQTVAEVWAQALNVSQVGVTDNFIELGGDSLVGMQVVARLRVMLQRPVSIRLLFKNPTARALSAVLDSNEPDVREASPTVRLQRIPRQRVREIRQERGTEG